MISIEQIISAALRDRTILDHLGEALTSDLVVASPLQRRVVEFAYEFSADKRKLPGTTDWSLWLQSLGERDQPAVQETLQRVMAAELKDFDPDFFSEQVMQVLRDVAARTAKARLNSLDQVTPEILIELSERVESISGTDLSGLADIRDWKTWASFPVQDDVISTGYPTLDEAIGGWGEELVIVFADSGVGKSMALQNFGSRAILQGLNGFHISLELGLRPMIHRYYRQITEKNRGEFKSDLDDSIKKLDHFFRFAHGEMRLIEFPAYDTDTSEIQRAIERVSRMMGSVDFIILDYLDLVTLPPSKQSRGGYEDLSRITHLVRSYCKEFGCPVITASQAVRKPEKADRLSVRDMGDSYGKVRGADVLLSLVQTPEEEEVHQGRLGVLKVREYGGRGTEVPLYINRDLALISELDQPNTIRLMRELGHLDERPLGASGGVG